MLCAVNPALNAARRRAHSSLPATATHRQPPAPGQPAAPPGRSPSAHRPTATCLPSPRNAAAAAAHVGPRRRPWTARAPSPGAPTRGGLRTRAPRADRGSRPRSPGHARMEPRVVVLSMPLRLVDAFASVDTRAPQRWRAMARLAMSGTRAPRADRGSRPRSPGHPEGVPDRSRGSRVARPPEPRTHTPRTLKGCQNRTLKPPCRMQCPA